MVEELYSQVGTRVMAMEREGWNRWPGLIFVYGSCFLHYFLKGGLRTTFVPSFGMLSPWVCPSVGF